MEILGARGVSVSQCDEPHELVTPTGAALLAELVDQFGPMREMRPSSTSKTPSLSSSGKASKQFSNRSGLPVMVI